MQVLPTLALGCLLILPTAAPAQQGERYTLDGEEVAVYNLAGTLTVEPGTGAVSVEVARGGADAAKLRVERGELDGQGDAAGRSTRPSRSSTPAWSPARPPRSGSGRTGPSATAIRTNTTAAAR